VEPAGPQHRGAMAGQWRRVATGRGRHARHAVHARWTLVGIHLGPAPGKAEHRCSDGPTKVISRERRGMGVDVECNVLHRNGPPLCRRVPKRGKDVHLGFLVNSKVFWRDGCTPGPSLKLSVSGQRNGHFATPPDGGRLSSDPGSLSLTQVLLPLCSDSLIDPPALVVSTGQSRAIHLKSAAAIRAIATAQRKK